MTNAAAKLREARFFLSLLTRIEQSGRPLLGNIHDLRDEYAFVLSGFLNACYAATEHLKSAAGKKETEQFKRLHPAFYGEGLRNLTVHERHVSPSPAHYMSFGTRPEPPIIRFEYYFSPGDPTHVTELCEQHYADLLHFASRYGITPEA